MSNMLPDLDESVSFVVDKGSPVGPIPMRSIIDSIRSGAREPDVLVWWAGAKDWVVFSNDSALLELLQELPATNQPPPPPPESPVVEDASVEIDDVQSRFPDPEIRSFDVSFGDGDQVDSSTEMEDSSNFEEAASELDEAELELQKAELELDDVLEGYPVQVDELIEEDAETGEDSPSDSVASEPFFDPAIEAEADVLLAGDPRSMHPSASWGDNETKVIDYSSIAEEAEETAGADDIAPVEEVEEAVHESVLETRAIDIEAFQKVLVEQEASDEESTEAVDRPEASQQPEPVDQTEAVDQPEPVDPPETVEEIAYAEENPSIEPSALATSTIDPSMLDELDSEEVSAHDDSPSDEEVNPQEDMHSDDAVQADDGDLEEAESNPAPDEFSSGLTGLFGSPNRGDVNRADIAAGEPPLAEDAPTSSLETVGARIDALTSATRRAQQGGALVIDEPELDVESTVAAELTEVSEDLGDQSPVADDIDEVEAADDFVHAHDSQAATDTDADTDNELQPSSGSWQAVEGPGLEDRFSEMVRLSVVHQRRLDWALRPDELLLSSCITAIVDRGYVLLDVENHETSQRAIFDHHDDSRHIRLELSPLSPVNAAGDPVGRHVQVRVAWGRGVQDADAAFATVRAHATDEVADPGTILCEANMVASSAMTSVDLIWAAQDFLRDDHSVDRSSLDESIIAILHALEARWYELFTAS